MENLKCFINWLFPHRCIACGGEVDEDSLFCPKCFSEIVFIDYPICKRCGRIFESPPSAMHFQELKDCSFDICESCQKYEMHFDVARAIFQYNDVSRRIIMKIKKQADNHAARICARRIFSKYREVFENADFITPVPSHWTRLLKRGFNPANIIAAELSKISDVKYSNFLKRNRKTDYQKNKTTIERLTNVKEAFVCATNLEGKSVIVADDVLTTGATLNECAKTLKTAGAKYVACVTIASASAKTG